MKQPPDRILNALSYDPETGVFRWLTPGPGKRADGIAGAKMPTGYVHISFERKLYYAHRLAVLFMTGKMPETEVDHANGVRSDNRWSNLRACTTHQNAQNLSQVKRKHDLPMGVGKNGSGFHAQIRVGGVSHYLGTHRTPEDAHHAYLQAKAKWHTFQPTLRAQQKALD
jgi:hypothetical protein